MLTQESLKEILDYNSETGVFRWRKKVDTRITIGQIAGCRKEPGQEYWVIKIKSRRHRAHRLAWLYVYGEWPPGQLDHVNRVKNDNRISNLRLTTQLQNNLNRVRSPLVGIQHIPERWVVTITAQGKKIVVGHFDTEAQAIAARRAAELLYFGAFAPVCQLPPT